MVENRITAPVGITTSILPAGNGLLTGVSAGELTGGLRWINLCLLSGTIVFLLALPLVVSALSAVALLGCAFRYLPTQYARMCSGN